MRTLHLLAAAVLAMAMMSAPARADLPPVAVTKGNPLKVYMHYMPWFDTPATRDNGQWGLHWTMANRNPNIVDSTGKRQIASHYYPKIGPYASGDPDVIEYHMLLMKYAGVDGVLMDWYGVQGTNGDINDLLENSNAIRDQTDDFGMKLGVVLEDRFSKTAGGQPDVNKAIANVAYLRDNYFNRPEYIRMGAGQDPLLMVFGPETFHTGAPWTQILAAANEDVTFLPLWYRSDELGSNPDGEYAWVYQDANTTNHLSHTSNFYAGQARGLNVAAGAAYPGFDDFYQEGGWGNNLFYIPSNDGDTLDDTLNLANVYDDRIDFLQLVTWNDFGEGTMLEPTVETGFSYLMQIQDFTDVPYGEDELQLVYRLYLARKEYENNAGIDAQLEEVSQLLGALEVEQAEALLNTVAPAGDYNGDGLVDAADFNTWRAAYGTQTILHGTGADGNFDGVIDAGDYTVWRNSMSESAGSGGLAVPEPSSLMLMILAFGLSRFRAAH